MVISEMEIRLRADIARLQRDMDSARQVVSNATAGMERAANAAKAALTSIGAGISFQQLAQMSDEYAKFTAQLKLATESQREYAAAYADVKRISTQSTQGLQETGMLYARIANGTRELGVAQHQVAAITETVNLSLLVSGAAASESASAQLQLSQAFASGALRGEEFNAVNEAAPRLMQALADGIGVPVGALKKMAEEGQITSQIMADVLPNALSKLRQEAKEVQTIAGAFTVLRNNAMEFVGVQASASGVVSALTQAITGLANNLKTVADVGIMVAAVFGSRMVASILSGIKAKMDDIMASRAQAKANEEAAGATLRRAQADRQAALIAQSKARENVAQVRAEVAADRERVASAARASEQEIIVRREQFVATAGIIRQEIALEKTRHAAQINGIGRAERVSEMARLSTQLAAVEKGIAAQSAALAAQRVSNEQAVANAAAAGAARIIAAREAETVATGAAAAATLRMRAANAALTAAISASSLAATVGRGALAVLGGPIGLITTALTVGATAWMLWGNKSEEANDKALQSTDETTKEMIARLDKQIEKLKERNKLAETEPRIKGLNELSEADKDGLARAKAALDANRGDQQAAEPRERMLLQLEEIELLNDYEGALKRVELRQRELAREKDIAFNKKNAEWLGQHGTAAQREAYELEKLRQEYGRVTPEMEKWVKARVADKGAAQTVRQEETAYRNLITSIHEKLAVNDLELSGYDKLTQSQQMTIKLDAAIGTGKNKLSVEHIKEARALIGKVEAQEQAIEAQQRAAKWAAIEAKNDADHYASLRAGSAAIDDRIKQMEREIETYGLTASAAIDMEKAKLQAKLDAGPATYAELIALDEQIAKLTKLGELTRKKERLEANVDVTQAKELLDIMSAIDESARSAAQGMADSFGLVGKAIGGLTTALSGLGKNQAAIAAQLAAATKAAAGDPAKVAAATAQAARQSAQAQIQSYGDMAAAGKGFFDEHSRGYQAMEAAEKTFRAFETALALKTMLEKSGILQAFTSMFVASKGAETAATVASVGPDVAASMVKGQAAAVAGVAGQAQGDPYTAWARMAAMAAVMAGLGFAVGGIGGHKDTTAADRQRATGTGSVLGDSAAKSESIAKAIELSAANSNIELNYTAGMLRSLRSIESSLSGLGSILLQNGVTGTAPASKYGSASQFANSNLGQFVLGGFYGLIGNMLTGGWLGKVTGSIVNAVFGGKTSAQDVGVMTNKTTLANALAGGLNAQSYADMKKDGGWFHSDDHWTDPTPLGAEANQQFSQIIKNMADAVGEAGKLLGLGGDAFTQRLNSFVVDIGKISTKDLGGDEIQKQLEAAFSKVGDDMARWSVDGLTQLQKVGEGALETLVRVASDYANLDSVLSSIGKSFGATGLASIKARESLIELAGGIDELASETASFAENFLTEAERLAPVQKYVTDQLASMGLAGLRSRESFKQYVLGLDLTSEAQRQQYVALMDLQEAFAKVYPEIVDTTVSLADAKSALADAYNAEVDAISATIDRMGSFASSLRSLRNSAVLGSLSPLSPQQKYAEAKAQYEAVLSAARSGDESAQSNYQAAFTSFLEASRTVFASSSQYQQDFYYAQAATEEAARWAETEVDVGRAQLTALERQVSGLIEVKQEVMSVRDAILQLNAVMGKNTAPLTAVAPPVNTPIPYSSYGTSNTEALVAEVKALRTEVAGLRSDSREQTGDLLRGGASASRESAQLMGRITESAISSLSRINDRVAPE